MVCLGGGGRIAISADMSKFRGIISAAGGNSVRSSSGAAGTIFVLNSAKSSPSASGSAYSTLLIGNEGQTNSQSTVISDHYPDGVDELSVIGSARVKISSKKNPFRIVTTSGDGSGQVEVVNGTVFLVPSERFILSGTSLVIRDSTINASLCEISNLGKLALSNLGSTSGAPLGVYTFTSLNVVDGGRVVLQYDNLNGSVVKINAVNVSVDRLSSISSDGNGYFGTSVDNSALASLNGPGAGSFGFVGGGGAGYGGQGGEGVAGAFGEPYGDPYVPTALGSGGGGGSVDRFAGGKGGGAVYLQATNLYLNGSLSANGMCGDGAGAGGGSGGSIFVNVTHLIGGGTITANGGDSLFSADSVGGTGAGGRVAVYTSRKVPGSWTGSATAYGGKFRPAHSDPIGETSAPVWISNGIAILDFLSQDRRRAGAGTIIFSLAADEEGRPFQELIVDNKGGNSTVTVAITIDSSGNEVALSDTFELQSSETEINGVGKAFDIVRLISNANLRTTSDTDISISSIINDGTGSFIVSLESNVTFPSFFLVSSGDLIVHGSINGARNLNVSNSGRVDLYPTASWCGYPCVHSRGKFEFSSINIMTNSGIVLRGGDLFSSDYATSVIYLNDTGVSLHIWDTLSYISADGEGYSPTTPGANDKFHGRVENGIGYGGSHAGSGGSASGWQSDALGASFSPVSWGGAGGSTHQYPGSKGGGLIHIRSKGDSSILICI